MFHIVSVSICAMSNHIGKGASGWVYKVDDQHCAKVCTITDKPLLGLSDDIVEISSDSQRGMLLNGKPFSLRPGGEQRKFRDAVNEYHLLQRAAGVPHVVHATHQYFGISGGYLCSVLEMECAPGETVENQIGRLPLADIGKLVADAGRAILGLGERGIVHRDVKPRNLMYHPQPTPGRGTTTVIDFGIAEDIREWQTPTPAHTGRFQRGTIHYLSPEHGRPQHLTPVSDWFALGLTAYKLLTADYAPVTDIAFGDTSCTTHQLLFNQLAQLGRYDNFRRDIIMGEVFSLGYSKDLAEAVGVSLDADHRRRDIQPLIAVGQQLAEKSEISLREL